MHQCLVLLLLIAACAAKQTGYSYPEPNGVTQNYVNTFQPQPQPQLQPQPQPQYGVPQYNTPPQPMIPEYPITPSVDTYQQPQPNYLAPAEERYKAEFFAFAGPEEEINDLNGAQQRNLAVEKKVRVVFIKTPEHNALEQAALYLAKQASDDRTAIYVLNKQSDIGDLANKINNIRDQQAHKPEVHFVKYRTPEEAAYAQQSIRAQYDAPQGPVQSSGEGVAPVLNYAPRQEAGGSVASPTVNYLPPQPAATPAAGAEIGGNIIAGPYIPTANSYGTMNTYGATNYVATNSYGAANSYSATNSYPGPYLNIDRGYQVYGNTAVPQANARPSPGSNFVFPTEAAPARTYLPNIRKQR